jgi:hypothetical protein
VGAVSRALAAHSAHANSFTEHSLTSPWKTVRKTGNPFMKKTSQQGSALATRLAAAWVVLVCLTSADRVWAAIQPPPGFVALFNGNDLSGWRGGDTFDHRKWLALPESERAAMNAAWTADMKKHWRVENGELVNDGHGKYATTEKDYGDFELLLEYKTVPQADSGIYLRGVPQVQIWDHTNEK